MLPILIIPVLICGILWIKSHPTERSKISAYQGWVVYLYAASYGVVAVFLSWLVAEYLFPVLIKSNLDFINVMLGRIGIGFPVDENYLDRLSSYLVETMGGGAVPGDKYASLLSARLLLVSIFSIFFTKFICLLCFLARRLVGLHKLSVIKIYRDNSYIDYQLMAISSYMTRHEKSKGLYEKKKRGMVKRNAKFKKNLRYIISFIGDDDREFLEWALSKYKKILFLQKDILLGIKRDIESDMLLAQITLDSRKVYIGVPRGFKFPDEHGVSGHDVVLYPWYSGYRKEDDLSIVITNTYFPLHEKGEEDVDNIVVSKSKIMSASAFSMKHYNKIQ